MGERISWAEGAAQMVELQALLMEVMGKEYPRVGYLVRTEEPELFIEYLNRAKQKDPLLQGVVISVKSMGVVVYQQIEAGVPRDG